MVTILPNIRKNAPFMRLTLGLALLVGCGTMVACKTESEAAPETGTDYYPVAVGNTWTYAVVDSTWTSAPPVPSVVRVSTFQFRETITDVFPDATGQPAYRMVRAKMVPPSTTWRDDSVFVLSATPQFVALSRDNTRTLELIFPVRSGRSWNLNGFNNSLNDTITSETRQYSRIGEAFSTGGGNSGQPIKTYSTTLTTTNTGNASENSLLKRAGYQQVFAKGVGPVFRRKVLFLNYYTNSNTGVTYFPGSYFSGFSRRETLISGPR